MKTNWFILFICLFVTINLHAQDFAPTGAKWYVPNLHFLPPSISVTTIESIGDTIINGLDCKHLVKDNWSCLINDGSFFIHQSGDSIYLYDALRDTFDTIIDFGAEVGEGWQFHYDYMGGGSSIDTISCTVDSVFYHYLSPTDSLKTQDVTLTSSTEFYVDGTDTIYNSRQARIYEKIGFQTALFPYFFPQQWICDANNDGPTRCYEDSIVGLLKFDTVDCEFVEPYQYRNFARITSKWYFPSYYAFSPDSSVITYESVADTTINGMLCRKVIKSESSCFIPISGPLFFYENNNVIQLYDPNSDSFNTMIDFDAEVGDSWIINQFYGILPDTFVCTVDSISSLNVFTTAGFGDNLKVQYVTLISQVNGQSKSMKIIEKIGFEQALIPIVDELSCDLNYESTIRCYSEFDYGMINFDGGAPCIPTPVEELLKDTDLEIFPNPTSDKLFFKTKELQLQSVQIFSLEGKLINEILFEQSEINLSYLDAGIYFLKIKSEQGLIVDKVVINRN